MILYHGSISKGVGFCTSPECVDFHKGVFLMAHSSDFKCPRCHKFGRKVMEYGETDNDYTLDFWQVRIEFNYDVVLDKYQGLAILSDEAMPKDGNIYTLYTPLVKTEKRAIALAEQLLGTLMRTDDSIFAKGFIPKDTTYNLDFDKPLAEVKGRLDEIASVIQQSRLTHPKEQ